MLPDGDTVSFGAVRVSSDDGPRTWESTRRHVEVECLEDGRYNNNEHYVITQPPLRSESKHIYLSTVHCDL
jgi:hypothetical protein